MCASCINPFIYGLKQTSCSWNKSYDQVIKTFDDQNKDEPCVCVQKDIRKPGSVFGLVCWWHSTHWDDVGLLLSIEIQLSTQFQMKDLGGVQYILGIKALRHRKNMKITLSQATYIDKLLVKYVMHDSKKGMLSFIHGVPLS